MKTTIGFLIFAAFLAMKACAYETDADKLDLDGIMANDDHHRALMHCMLQKITCMELKESDLDILQDAVKTRCRLCKDDQKTKLNKFLTSAKTKFPEDFVTFKQKYDRENIYMDDFLDSISQY